MSFDTKKKKKILLVAPWGWECNRHKAYNVHDRDSLFTEFPEKRMGDFNNDILKCDMSSIVNNLCERNVFPFVFPMYQQADKRLPRSKRYNHLSHW